MPLITSFLNHLSNKTISRKQGPQCVFRYKEDVGYARLWTLHYLTTIQNESGKTQITFRKEKYHNGMVRTNNCEPNK